MSCRSRWPEAPPFPGAPRERRPAPPSPWSSSQPDCCCCAARAAGPCPRACYNRALRPSSRGGSSTMKLFRAAALGAAVCLVVAAPAASESGPQFSVYPSYSAKFDIASEKFSLVTNLVVYNISGQTFTDVTFKQTYPDGVTFNDTYPRHVVKEATRQQQPPARQ